MSRSTFFLGIGIASSVIMGIAITKFLQSEKSDDIRNVISDFADEKKKSLIEQRGLLEEKITDLATKIADNSKQLVDKGLDYAQDKKNKIVDSIEEAKKAMQEEKERLKEIRARLQEGEDEEVI